LKSSIVKPGINSDSGTPLKYARLVNSPLTPHSVKSSIPEIKIKKKSLVATKDLKPMFKFAGLNHHFGQGMNGHPDYTADQIPNVIQLAKDMGLNSFRGDFNTDSNGNPSYNGDLFLKASKAAFMKNYVTLYIKGRGRLPINGTDYSKEELNDAERVNYNAAKGFASKYPEVEYYQIDNELDVKSVGKTNRSLVNYSNNRYGLSKDDSGYNLITYPMLIVQIKAIMRGIKDANPRAKGGMNFAWRHSGIIQRINKDIPLDFVGIDAYNSEEYSNDENNRPTFGRFVDLLKSDFPNVPEYIVTEMGFKPSKARNMTAGQYLPLLFKKYLSECNGVFLYEAINEPRARARSRDNDEARLGMDFETVQSFKTNVKARKD
jgi:hypothetical protein